MSWAEEFSEADYQRYWHLTPEDRRQLLSDDQLTEPLRALLLYQQGQHSLAQNQVNDAIVEFGDVLSMRPGWHEAWAGHAAALLKAGELEAAIASCDRALEIDPANAVAWSVQGTALYRLKKYAEAADRCDRALELNPDDYQAWQTLSDALHRQGQYAAAVVSYDKALALRPDAAFIWGDRGAALQRLGRYEEALASYDKLLQAEPTRYKLWHQRGLVLRKLRRFESAIANFDEALTLQPDFYPATRSKLFVLLRTGQLLHYLMDGKTLAKRKQVTNDLRNVLDNTVKTKLPTLVVLALMALSSTHSQATALAIAGVFLLIAAVGDLITESQK